MNKIDKDISNLTESELVRCKYIAMFLYTIAYIIGCTSVCLMLSFALKQMYILGTIWGGMTAGSLITIIPLSNLLDKIKDRLFILKK